jgi:hypothetical protein
MEVNEQMAMTREAASERDFLAMDAVIYEPQRDAACGTWGRDHGVREAVKYRAVASEGLNDSGVKMRRERCESRPGIRVDVMKLKGMAQGGTTTRAGSEETRGKPWMDAMA